MQEIIDEFQIGNWIVYHPEGNYCTIQSISPNLILQGALRIYQTTIQRIEAIEITEDKLQVCGFDVQHPRFIKKSNSGISIELVVSSFSTYKLYKNDEEFCKVRFIHQVQNAYYIITGELLRGNLYGVRER